MADSDILADEDVGEALIQYILVPKDVDLRQSVLATLADTPVSSAAAEAARQSLSSLPTPGEDLEDVVDGRASNELVQTFELDELGSITLVFNAPALRQTLRQFYFENGWEAVQNLYSTVVDWAKATLSEPPSTKGDVDTHSVNLTNLIDAVHGFETAADELSMGVLEMLSIAEVICNETISNSLKLVREHSLQQRFKYQLVEERPRNPAVGEAMPAAIWKFGARVDGETPAAASARIAGAALWEKLKRMRVSYDALHDAQRKQEAFSKELADLNAGRPTSQGGAHGGSGHQERPLSEIQRDLDSSVEAVRQAESDFAAALAEVPSNSSFDPHGLPLQRHPLAATIFRHLDGKVPRATTGQGFDIDVATVARAAHEVTQHSADLGINAQPKSARRVARDELQSAIAASKDERSGGVEFTPRHALPNPHQIYISVGRDHQSGIVQLGAVSKVFEWLTARVNGQNSVTDKSLTKEIAGRLIEFERDEPLAVASIGHQLIELLAVEQRGHSEHKTVDVISATFDVIDIGATILSFVPGLQIGAGLLKVLSICAILASTASTLSAQLDQHDATMAGGQAGALEIGDPESSWRRYATVGEKIGQVPSLAPLIVELVGSGLMIGEIVEKVGHLGGLWMLIQMTDAFADDDDDG